MAQFFLRQLLLESSLQGSSSRTFY